MPGDVAVLPSSVEQAKARRQLHWGLGYRAPRELRASPFSRKRVLVVGSCLSYMLSDFICSTGFNTAEHILTNNAAALPPKTQDEIAAYDFQIVQIPTRSVIPEQSYLRLHYSDVEGYQRLFEQSCIRLEQAFEAETAYNAQYGMMTLVSNLLLPQQNPMGRLLPRYDLRNPVYMIEELNRFLDGLIRARTNVHLLDADSVAATFGRRYSQDDGVWLINHGSTITNFDFDRDQGRMEPPDSITEYYPLNGGEFLLALWHEAEALHASLSQTDAVKLVVVDLDDTLWRGVLIEQGQVEDATREGWPGGVIEALLTLKRRGVLLAIVSKNDEARIRAIWEEAVGELISLDDFAVVKINWKSKAENLEDVLVETNLLPRNVVYIDDNPVERAHIRDAFPDVRVLGEDLYYIRRILLWSPETQVPFVTAESDRRTEMIQQQIARDGNRRKLSRDEFLASLKVEIAAIVVTGETEAAFARSFELLNKTNQFNTTGRRWSNAECTELFRRGGYLMSFDVRDSYVKYGIVCVAVVEGAEIRQMVMSCRVVGLDVEFAAVSVMCRRIADAGSAPIVGRAEETDANHLSRDIFSKCGFERGAGGWVLRAGSIPAWPPHIRIAGQD